MVVSMEPLVVEYLRTHSFLELENEHGINVRPTETFDKVSLNYDSIFSKNGNKVAEECRGLVIRPKNPNVLFAAGDNWKTQIVGDVQVIAWPLTRFYNFGDPSCAPIDWDDPKLSVYEKVDGTCIICYWDTNTKKWCAGTRSVSEANIPIMANHIEIGNMTFSQLFLKALYETRVELNGGNQLAWAKCANCDCVYERATDTCVKEKTHSWYVDTIDKVLKLNKELTYIFELVSPYNQIVVEYKKPQVYLLAARHTTSGKEIALNDIDLPHVYKPKMWNLKNSTAVCAFVNSMSPSELEGVVLCDSQFRRIKIKSMAYVLAHKSKDSLTASPRNALEAIILEKIDDVLPLVPEAVSSKLLDMQQKYAQYCKNIDAKFAQFYHEANGNRKRFAEQVLLDGDWNAPYFNLWENHARNTKDWIKVTCEKNRLSAATLDKIIAKLA